MSDTDIDAKVGKLLGLPCVESFQVMDKAGKVYYFHSPDEGEAKAWLADELLKRPNGSCKGCSVIQDHWYLSSTGDLGQAMSVVDEMFDRGFRVSLFGPTSPYTEWICSFELYEKKCPLSSLWEASSTNPAEAVVLAALACIEGNPETFETEAKPEAVSPPVAEPTTPDTDELNYLQKLGEGALILATRYSGGNDTLIKKDRVTIGDKRPHGFDAETVARLHRLGWELVKGGKFRFMHIPF